MRPRSGDSSETSDNVDVVTDDAHTHTRARIEGTPSKRGRPRIRVKRAPEHTPASPATSPVERRPLDTPVPTLGVDDRAGFEGLLSQGTPTLEGDSEAQRSPDAEGAHDEHGAQGQGLGPSAHVGDTDVRRASDMEGGGGFSPLFSPSEMQPCQSPTIDQKISESADQKISESIDQKIPKLGVESVESVESVELQTSVASVAPHDEAPLSDQEVAISLKQRAAEARAQLHELCRQDINAFAEYVLKDDETGLPLEQADFHVRAQHALTEHRQIVVMSHPESGKTTNIAVGRVLWELGRNPNLRVMLLYNAEDSAAKTLGAIKRYIETSRELHAVFPLLKRGSIWKDDQIFVQRSAYDRNPSIVAVGYNSRRIGGSRVDLLIVDDLLDAIVTATEAQRRKLSSWVKNTVFTRLSANALVAFLTNAWHPRDLAHELIKERGWFLICRPIRNPDGTISWSRWTEKRLKQKRKDLGPLEYARSFECNPRDDEARVFRPEHIEQALKAGKGYGFLSGIDVMPQNCLIVTGIDLAAGDDTKTKGARTVLSSVFFHPNQQRQLVRMRSGRWRARQILDHVAAVGQLFPTNHWIVVENNGVQRYILDLAHENGVDVGVALVPFTTGRNKADPRFGIASLAAEFEGRRWILPSDCDADDQEEVEGLVSQLIDYVPEAHTGDRLMATWFAREIGRRIFARFFGSGRFYSGSSVRAIG